MTKKDKPQDPMPGNGNTTFSGQVTIHRYINHVENYHEAADASSATPSKSMRETIDQLILPFIKNQRGWFGFSKAVMERRLVSNGDFAGVERLLLQIYPEGIPMGFNARDLTSLNSGTYVKPIDEWDANTVGTDGKFSEIKTVALRTLLAIPVGYAEL